MRIPSRLPLVSLLLAWPATSMCGCGKEEAPPRSPESAVVWIDDAAAGRPSADPSPGRDPVVDAVDAVLHAYEVARAAFAEDSLKRVVAAARKLKLRLRAPDLFRVDRRARDGVFHALKDADDLAAADDLATARRAFGELSRNLVALLRVDARYRRGWFLFECPRARCEGFALWLQRSPEMSNPYLGQRLLRCGAARTWEDEGTGDARDADHGGRRQGGVQYTCTMHPLPEGCMGDTDVPGKCPICGMDLVPVDP